MCHSIHWNRLCRKVEKINYQMVQLDLEDSLLKIVIDTLGYSLNAQI